MAINLEIKSLKDAFDKGTFPNENQEKSISENILKFTTHIRWKLLESFLWVLLMSVLALAVGYYKCTIGITLDISVTKVLTFLGSALVGWATLFELGGGVATMSGEALHEVIHPILFKILFVPGLLLLFAGVVL
jgi:hypothetical protein